MSLELFIPLGYFWLWEWFTSSTYTLGECLELLNHSWYLKRKPLKIQWFSAVTHLTKSEFCHFKRDGFLILWRRIGASMRSDEIFWHFLIIMWFFWTNSNWSRSGILGKQWAWKIILRVWKPFRVYYWLGVMENSYGRVKKYEKDITFISKTTEFSVDFLATYH